MDLLSLISPWYSPPSGVFRTAVVACMQGEDIYTVLELKQRMKQQQISFPVAETNTHTHTENQI